MQVGKPAKIGDHFGNVRIVLSVPLDDNPRGHIEKDSFEDCLEFVGGVAFRAIHLEDAIVRPLPLLVLFVFLRMVESLQESKQVRNCDRSARVCAHTYAGALPRSSSSDWPHTQTITNK